MKIDPYDWRHKCRLVTLVSGNIRLMRYTQEFPRQGTSNNSAVIENCFSAFAGYVSENFKDEVSTII